MKKTILSIAALVCAMTMSAQTADDTMNPLITAMPSVSIAPDARSAGMGDLGVATDADFRRMGYASDCISGICKDFRKNGEEIFLACNDLQSENFYRKIGFIRKEYMDVGIFEI